MWRPTCLVVQIFDAFVNLTGQRSIPDLAFNRRLLGLAVNPFHGGDGLRLIVVTQTSVRLP